jgi:hypothetical protein
MLKAVIISNVNIRLNEIADDNVSSSELVSTPYIESLIIPSANNLLMKVPVNAVLPEKYTASPTSIIQDGLTGKILITNTTFLRLHSLKMDSWKRAVSVVSSESSNVYNLQKNTVTRGNPDRPIVIQTHYYRTAPVAWFRALQYFSVETENDGVDYLYYIKKITSDTNVFQYETILEDLLVWEIVMTCLIILGEKDKAANVDAIMQRTITSLMN